MLEVGYWLQVSGPQALDLDNGMPPLKRIYSKFEQLVSVYLNKENNYITLICIVSLILSTKGITNEGNISLNGDMPRYMMNGVFCFDLIRDLPLSNIFGYTEQYFARYPALSLGHHPLLPAIALVPFYAIFGISVSSAKLMGIFFMILSGVVWFRLILCLYDKNIALFSSLLLVSNPYIVDQSRVVMSEIPCLALIILTFYFLNKYCILEHKRYLIAFAFTSVLSVYAKHTAIFMFPFYVAFFVMSKGIKHFLRKEVIVVTVIITLLILPLIPITLKYSQYNVSISKRAISTGVTLDRLSHVLQASWKHHISMPVLALSLISACISLYRREKREIAFMLWIIVWYLFSVTTGAPTHRHTIFWIPAFCLLATAIVNALNYRLWKVIILTVILLISGYQFMISFGSKVEFVYGYEEASKYVAKNWKGASVMYSPWKDTGYFVFFMKKHSQNQDRVVLRADKILATSAMHHIVEDRIYSTEEIYDILDKFGVFYVVITDAKFKSPALEMLRKEVKSDRFILHKKIPIQASSLALNNKFLAIYEYKGHTTFKKDTILQMDIPLAGDSIAVPLRDLIKNMQ